MNSRYDYETELADNQAELEEYRRQRERREHERRRRRALERRRRKQRILLIRGIIMLVVIIIIICVVVFSVKQIKEHRAEKAQQEMQMPNESDDKQSGQNTGGDSDEGNATAGNDEQDDEDIDDPNYELVMSSDEYPDSLKNLYKKNEEAREFVLAYPEKKGTVDRSSLDEYAKCPDVPLLMQWDERWGYYQYGDDVVAVNGCGPTCLSMVALYLTRDTDMTPVYIADFAMENDYYLAGSGSKWELMEEGATRLGLQVEELTLNENTIEEELKNGNPIICVMGPGDFTDNGHYIVLTSWESGTVLVNDPNSKENSMKRWVFDDIKDQIKDLWVYKK